MISGRPISLLILLASVALISSTAVLAADTSDALIQRLARPAPASIVFTEVRFSRLLRAPLIVSGKLSYDGPQTLQRHVLEPYEEHTVIQGESVRVEREGEPPRSFALQRAPELRGLMSGFSALLGGDPAALRQNFAIDFNGDENQWTLQLTPTDARARRRLQGIVVNGSQNEPRCLQMLTADGAASITLLGDAANLTLSNDITLPAVQSHCQASVTQDGTASP